MSRELRRAAACRNCGAEVTGNFCSACGQENTDYRVSLRRLVGDLVDEVFQLESRLWRTLWTLFRRPGQLTREYNAGRRVRYTTPLRLYLLASVAYFFVASVTPPPKLDVNFGGLHATASDDADELSNRFARQLDRRIKVVQKDPQAAAQRAAQALLEWGPRITALLVPLFALLTFGFFRRPRHFFVEHLVFALHLHAATFFLWMLDSVIGHGVAILLFIGEIVWTFLAARNVFQQSWWRLSWKLPLLGFIYLTFVGLGVAAAALWGIFNV
jgi:hypothetical protein